MRGLIFAVCLVVMGCALSDDDPTVYRAISNEQGWAIVHIEGFSYGDAIEVTAWQLKRH